MGFFLEFLYFVRRVYYSMDLVLQLQGVSQKTLAELKGSQYSKENPHLIPNSLKIPMKTDENVALRNYVHDFASLNQVTPFLINLIFRNCCMAK